MIDTETTETTEASEAPEAVTAANPGESTEQHWYSDLPEDLRDNATLHKYQTPEEAMRGHVNLASKIGKDTLQMPETDEDREAIYTALGRPEASDGYSIERPEMPDGVPYDQESEDFYRDLAFDAGLSDDQFKKFYDGEIKRRLDGFDQVDTASKEYARKLNDGVEKELGSALPKYKSGAQAVMTKYSDDGFVSLLESTEVDGYKLGDHPVFFKAMGKIGLDMMGESKLKGGEGLDTPADMTTGIADYRSKHSEALGDRDHPEHKLRTAGLTALYSRRDG